MVGSLRICVSSTAHGRPSRNLNRAECILGDVNLRVRDLVVERWRSYRRPEKMGFSHEPVGVGRIVKVQRQKVPMHQR